jgi:hypothetical protein
MAANAKAGLPLASRRERTRCMLAAKNAACDQLAPR